MCTLHAVYSAFTHRVHLCLLQAAAELQVEAGVGRVEAALKGKLVQTQALAQGLEQALAAANHELSGLSRSQQRLSSMVTHLQAKAGINKSRQQVCRHVQWSNCGDGTAMMTAQAVVLSSCAEHQGSVQHSPSHLHPKPCIAVCCRCVLTALCVS